MKLLYITENINAVFYSQVVELLNKIQEKNFFEEIYLAIGLRNLVEVKSINGVHNNIKILTFKTYPIYPLINYMNVHSIDKLLSNLHVDQTFVIHTRTQFWGAMVTKSKTYHKNLLVDIRGSVFEEIEIYGTMHDLLKNLKLFNYKKSMANMLKQVNFINTVSEPLKNYVIKEYHIEKCKISVIPTIAGTEFDFNMNIRQETRDQLKLRDEEILFVFSSGSSQSWQNDDAIVEELTKQGYKVLMLTKKKFDNPNVISMFVPYTDVPKYLNAADISIIIRNDDTVNNVASPIKFSEYLACGLPIIANKSVNIINELIANTKYGVVSDLSQIHKNDVDYLLTLNRNNIAMYGKSIFGIDTIVEKYLLLYKKMLSNKMIENNILIVTPQLTTSGGVSSFWNALLPELTKYDDLTVNNLQIGGHGKNVLGPLLDQWHFRKAIIQNVDLVFLNPSLGSRSFFRDALFAKQLIRKQVPFVVFFHGWSLDFEQKVNAKYRDFFLKTLGQAKKIFVLSQDFKNKILEWGYEGEVIVETTNVDANLLNGFSIDAKIESMKTTETIKILFLARLLKEKGVFETVEAFQNLCKKYEHIELTIAGDGKDLDVLKALVAEEPKIIVAGYVEGKNKIELFEQSHIYCFPTFYGEGLPTSILEAMAFAMPVVTTNMGGLKEFFKDDEMGYFVEPKNVKQLEEKLELLLTDRENIITIGRHNAHYAKERLLSTVVAKRLHNYMLDAIKG